MFKNIFALVISGVLLFNVAGCIFVAAGAGGAGTAVWLSGKLSEEFHYPYERVINASKKALSSLRFELVKETKETNITQLKSKYTDGKEIWIDIRKITENSSKVEVRVGAVSPDKDAADNILKRIARYL